MAGTGRLTDRRLEMDLEGFLRRSPVPVPWSEGEKIPWADPDFSRRMLAEHLSQDHDSATRRKTVVAHHVAWIHDSVLRGDPSRILDLGCGPGLYTCGLAARGHDCVGIDIGPASIAYARTITREAGLACQHVEADVRTADFGTGFDLVMMIFGELHAFWQADAARILGKAFDALGPGGRLLLELHEHDWHRERGHRPRSWTTAEAELFSDQPHLVLMESFWDDDAQVATRRFAVVDAATGRVDIHIEHLQAYHEEAVGDLLSDAGFAEPRRHASLTGESADAVDGLYALVAVRPA